MGHCIMLMLVGLDMHEHGCGRPKVENFNQAWYAQWMQVHWNA